MRSRRSGHANLRKPDLSVSNAQPTAPESPKKSLPIVNGDMKTDRPVQNILNGTIDKEHSQIDIPKIITNTAPPIKLATQVPSQPSVLGSPMKRGALTPSGDVISTNQKLVMDILYANQAVALKQGSESDDGSEGSGEVKPSESLPNGLDKKPSEPSQDDIKEESPKKDSVSAFDRAKAEAEKMFANKPISSVQPPAISESKPKVVTPEPVMPVVPKKDSDIMWEKLLQQKFKVCSFPTVLHIYIIYTVYII